MERKTSNIFIGGFVSAGSSFMTYVMGSFVRMAENNQDYVLTDIIRVSEMPTQRQDGSMSIQLAVLSDIYFSVAGETTLSASGMLMRRFANPDTDAKLIAQYEKELDQIRVQRSGLIHPRAQGAAPLRGIPQESL